MTSKPNDHFSKISYLMIEVNSQCNLSCTFCNRDELVAKGLRTTKTLSPQEFRNLLAKFKDCPIDTIKLEGISEPMLHPQFSQCAQVIREFFPNAHVIIATNLQYKIEKTEFFKTLPFVDCVYLSIDGVGEVYEKARPPAKFDKVIMNLETIRLKLNAQERSKLEINFVCTEYNYKTLPDMFDLKEKYDLGKVRINLAQNWNENELNDHTFHDEMLSFVKQYKQYVRGVAIWDYEDCFWPYEGIIVDVYGDVRQCIINTSQDPICNIYKDNIKEVYNSSIHYKRVRSSLEKNCPATECSNCDYKFLTKPLLYLHEGNLESMKPRKVNK